MVEFSIHLQMMLVILVISSTLSFTLNAYNFLFVQRFAIYFWFAVLPLLWIAIPLTVGAWATDTYQTFAGVVLKNWAQTSGDTPRTSVQENDVTTEVSCITCQSKTSQRASDTGTQYARRKFQKGSRTVIRPLQVKPCSENENNSFGFQTGGENTQNGFTLPYELSRDSQRIGWRVREPAIGEDIDQRMREPIGEQGTGNPKRNEPFITSSSYPQSTGVRFDFERYIIYLQCMLPDVGFSVGGCLITWDKVFGLAVFMTSLAAVFIQEVMFGSRKNTIGRP
jgi:hypothetical protein